MYLDYGDGRALRTLAQLPDIPTAKPILGRLSQLQGQLMSLSVAYHYTIV